VTRLPQSRQLVLDQTVFMMISKLKQCHRQRVRWRLVSNHSALADMDIMENYASIRLLRFVSSTNWVTTNYSMNFA
jgi:hypothetical protein